MDESNAGAGNPAPDAKAAEEFLEPVQISDPALREDQIQNAVAFLTHPKVRGSAVSAKRSFLEKKGLTAAEIDEAFKRVPELPATPTATTLSTSSTPTYGANNLVTYTQQSPGTTHMPSTAVVPQTAAPGGGAVVLHPHQQMQAMQPVQQPLRWAQVVLGVGVAAAGAYGLHQLIAPRISSWAAHIKASRAAAAEAEAQRTAALTAALESLAAGQTKLQETLESLQTAIGKQQQLEQQHQQHEERYRPVSDSRRNGYPNDTVVRSSHSEYLRCQSPGVAAAQQRQQYYLGSSSGPSSYDASRAAAIRGWDPYESSQSAAAAATPGYSSTAAAGGVGVSNGYGVRTDGFEVVPRNAAPADMYSSSAAATPVGGRGAPLQQQQQSVAESRPDEAPHSAAFQEVMEMVRAGITPPNVRTDINDSPPDPNRPISAPQLQPTRKPWERSSGSSNTSVATAAPHIVSNTPRAAVGDNLMQQQHQDGLTTWSGPQQSVAEQQEQGMAAAGNAIAAEMEQAAAVRHKSNELATGYNMSHLLGSDSTRHDAPWRPPPPPAPTVTAARPNSSGSSSSKAAAAAGGVVADGNPALAVADGTDQVVADVAADVVRNVVQSAEETQAAAAAAGSGGQVEEVLAA